MARVFAVLALLFLLGACAPFTVNTQKEQDPRREEEDDTDEDESVFSRILDILTGDSDEEDD